MPALDYPHIQKTGAEAAHLERLPRIRVAQIVADSLGNGWSGEEILRQYPPLTPSEVYAALAYYHDHREEIDAELKSDVAACESDDLRPASPLRLRLLAARRNRAA